MDNSPGVYRLEVNASNELIITTTGSASLPNFRFDAEEGSASTFTFEIHFPDGTFDDPPITPVPGQQSGIDPQVDESRTKLDLVVIPPTPLPADPEFHFKFVFAGTDIPMQGDPTIVEKPPETPPNDQG